MTHLGDVVFRHSTKPTYARAEATRPPWPRSRRADGRSNSKTGEIRFRGQTGKHWPMLSLSASDSEAPDRGGSNQHPALLERQDYSVVAWYRSLYAPRTGGAYDSHHRTTGIAGRTQRAAVAWPLAGISALRNARLS